MSFKEIKSNKNAIFPNAQSRGCVYDSIQDTIGATPLVRLSKFMDKYNLESEILAKLEFFNPLSSVKDRIGFAMIEMAEREGKIKPGVTTIVEPTSGNTGIALAFVAASRGYKLILTMPESMSVERRKMLIFLGAELVLTSREKGMQGAIDRAAEIVAKHDDAFSPSQFENVANPQIHVETTAEEIWLDTNGDADILVAGVGTGGTITGISRALKAHNSNFKTYAVEPSESPILSGGEAGPHKIQGIGAGFVPSILDVSLIDGIVKIDSDTAIATSREIAILEGIPCGISSGAALAAAIEVAQMPENKGKKIITILPSFAERYLSGVLFEGMFSYIEV